MIYCPQCGKRTSVLETRADAGIARRKRERPLGHRFSTEERVVKTSRSLVQLMSDREQSDANRGVLHA